MRKLLLFLLLISAGRLAAQTFNNEWIDYAKTYYKFKVGKTGLYRINQSALPSAIQNTPAQSFQLWRNGKQVVLYTSIATGVLTASDYLEFWGEQNDGQVDKSLYRNPSFQVSDKISLQTDTAAFFLTVNPSPSVSNPNLRYNISLNDLSNPLPADAFFMYTYRINFKDIINRGFAVNAGENVYSSSYDVGEGWSTNEIQLLNPYTVKLPNLYPATSGGAATLNAVFSANAPKTRNVVVQLNTTALINQIFNGFTTGTFSNNNVSLAGLSGNNDSLKLRITTIDTFDRIVCNYVEIKYPRQFNFGGSNNFTFSLSPSTQGNVLNITNFNSGSVAPVLYDFTNNLRYVANTVTSGILKFALPSSLVVRDFVLVSQDVSAISFIQSTNMQQRSFTNYVTSQANYLIVSNKLLGLNATGAVEVYRQYRSSQAGGGYTAKVYDIDDLVDQFGFGIKKHPLSIKNFVRYAKQTFTSIAPKYIFLLGKGITYDTYRSHENTEFADQLNLVPTWGWPASDNLLVSADLNPIPSLGVGRLSAVNQKEVNDYLSKIKEYDARLSNPSQTVADKAWMKSMLHIVGADDTYLNNELTNYLKSYENIVIDTLVGATVTTFNKTSSSAISGSVSADLFRIVNNGISMLSYFGHSAASALSFNLNEPSDYSNAGKYYMFFANGCSAGNFFDYDPYRLTNISSIAEKFVSAPNRGSIGFIGSTHFGITTYLNVFARAFYQSLAGAGYSKPVTDNMYQGSIALRNGSANFSDDFFFYRTHAEQSLLNGDPAIKIYAFEKPDFAVEDAQVVITPSILSVTDNQFTVKSYFYNLGMATRQGNTEDSVSVTIKRQYPDGSIQLLYNKKIKAVRNLDSVILTLPLIPSRDKGTNSIIVSIDPDGKYDELSEMNNSVTKSFIVFDDAVTPVYPYNHAIINKSTAKLVASTANPFSPLRNYIIELDTTELFNSSIKISRTVSVTGGIIEFDPGITFKDSTVYYWRVAQVPTGTGTYNYSKSSFVYLPNVGYGFNQSHLYQHTHSTFAGMGIDSTTGKFFFNTTTNKVVIKNSVFIGDEDELKFSIAFNDDNNPPIKGLAFRPNSLTFNVFDSISLTPMFNNNVGQSSQYGSLGYPAGNSGREFDFAFALDNTNNRNAALSFMDNIIPNGAYVVIRSSSINGFFPYYFADQWKLDGTNSLYSRLKSVGFADIDSFNRPRAFIFVYRKGVTGFTPISLFSEGIYDQLTLRTNFLSKEKQGSILSPKFGIASNWKNLVWNGTRTDATDIVKLQLLGFNQVTNKTDTLKTLTEFQPQISISDIDAVTYPNLQMYLTVKDTVKLSPYQLRYWRLLYDPLPEGAMAPNIKYTFKDTMQIGDQMNMTIAFKNVSDVVFRDSLVVKMTILDKNNVTTTIPIGKLKKLAPGDTAVVATNINSMSYPGVNTVMVDVNPENNQPEQFHFNNFIYRNFFVNADVVKPVLDVTFDGIHILNRDIVSAKPNIRIKLKDESKFLALDDTSLLTLQLRFPDNTVRRYRFNTDTLRFNPANLASGENAATADFTPYLSQDGVYELTVTGKDKTGNASGTQQYVISFMVYNKAMISNVFNYPNPFTTSTAFAFTLTGSQVPQNIKIQILTVTGKIVREITSDELGPIHIGNNITQFKWDGKDMYGASLGNGVYLYRIVTNLNGVGLDKFNIPANGGGIIDTDKYFKAGYGKMYLMR